MSAWEEANQLDLSVSLSPQPTLVAISYLNEEEDAADTVSWVEEAGRKALKLPGDISDGEHCRDIVERTDQQ